MINMEALKPLKKCLNSDMFFVYYYFLPSRAKLSRIAVSKGAVKINRE